MNNALADLCEVKDSRAVGDGVFAKLRSYAAGRGAERQRERDAAAGSVLTHGSGRAGLGRHGKRICTV